jgi:UDP-glucose 4-epimerase
MTILVTGGAGYIGSHMVHALVDAGEQVVVLDNLSTGFASAIPQRVPLKVGDLGDQELVRSILEGRNIETVMHFAASTIVPDSMRRPLHYYRNNTLNSELLIELALEAGVRNFIFSSTCAIYGNSPKRIVSEDDTPAPVSPYASSKLMTEIMLRDVSAISEMKHVILRYFNVAGADPSGRTGPANDAPHLMKVAVETALSKRESMEIYGTDYDTADGTAVRDYVHVTDLVAAHIEAVRHLRNAGQSLTLNCGYSRGHSVLDVIRAVKRVSGVDFSVMVGNRRPGDVAAIVADAARVRSMLGWKPQFDNLDTIVRHALAWESRLLP